MLLIKKFVSNTIFNFSLILILFVGIQNSYKKSRVNLLFNDTVNLPLSFIMGTSFIAGSIFGGFLPLNHSRKKE